MDSLSPTNPPSTPLEKIHHISTHLDTLLKELQTKPRDATPDKDTLQELVQYFRRQQTALTDLAMPPPPLPTLPRPLLPPPLYLTVSTTPNMKILYVNL
jgi:hypothetical protein